MTQDTTTSMPATAGPSVSGCIRSPRTSSTPAARRPSSTCALESDGRGNAHMTCILHSAAGWVCQQRGSPQQAASGAAARARRPFPQPPPWRRSPWSQPGAGWGLQAPSRVPSHARQCTVAGEPELQRLCGPGRPLRLPPAPSSSLLRCEAAAGASELHRLVGFDAIAASRLLPPPCSTADATTCLFPLRDDALIQVGPGPAVCSWSTTGGLGPLLGTAAPVCDGRRGVRRPGPVQSAACAHGRRPARELASPAA